MRMLLATVAALAAAVALAVPSSAAAAVAPCQPHEPLVDCAKRIAVSSVADPGVCGDMKPVECAIYYLFYYDPDLVGEVSKLCDQLSARCPLR